MGCQVKHFFDPETSTLSYVVYDETSLDSFVVDPVWNYEPQGASLTSRSVDELVSFLEDNNLNLHYILETHAHADHLSGAQLIKEKFPEAKLAIRKEITIVQETFQKIFHLDLAADGSQFDKLLSDGEMINCGTIKVKVIATPGHTPACTCYYLEEEGIVFTGDALFMPDSGTGRCDFPKGSANDLYESVTQKIYQLPESTRAFTGHDYQPGGRELKCEATIIDHKEKNIHLPASKSRDDFVKFRNDRDATLKVPKLLLQSVQININGGKLFKAEANGTHYLKIPLDRRG